MSPDQQSDVKAHLSNYTRSHIHLMPRATVPQMTADPGAKTGSADLNTGHLALGTQMQSPAIESQIRAKSVESDSSREVLSTQSKSVTQ